MDKKKIAFITCVNDEAEYAECRFYLDRLHIPEGYHVDRIEIRGASSLASGYNAGMQSTDARYKVYLHQDVFMINVELINDLLAVFEKDEQIGLVGVIGSRNPKMWDATRITLWDSGRVFTNMAVLIVMVTPYFFLPWNNNFISFSSELHTLRHIIKIPTVKKIFPPWDIILCRQK